MEQKRAHVAVVTVTYGKRWHFLLQVIEAVLKDSHVSCFIIVDNGSQNKDEIKRGVHEYGERVIILRSEKNIGSAGGFALGLEKARTIDCDFVYILDDDNVPEEGSVDTFLRIKKQLNEEKVVLVGNRVDIPGSEEVFYHKGQGLTEPKGTFFEPVSLVKIAHFISLLFKRKLNHSRELSSPREFVPNESFVYGGAFIPIEAIRKAPLPDKDLVLYGDDIEYSWGIKRLGYSSYVCYSPKIHDLEVSFGESSQVVGLFDQKTLLFRVYYRIRNMVLISRRNTRQSKIGLLISILVWIEALSFLGLVRYGFNKNYVKRVFLMWRAVYAGYFPNTKIPEIAKLP